MVEKWNCSSKEVKDEVLLFDRYDTVFSQLQGIMPEACAMLDPDFATNETCTALRKLTSCPPETCHFTDSDERMNDINNCLTLLSPFLDLLQQQYAELKLAIGRIAQAEEGLNS